MKHFVLFLSLWTGISASAQTNFPNSGADPVKSAVIRTPAGGRVVLTPDFLVRYPGVPDGPPALNFFNPDTAFTSYINGSNFQLYVDNWAPNGYYSTQVAKTNDCEWLSFPSDTPTLGVLSQLSPQCQVNQLGMYSGGYINSFYGGRSQWSQATIQTNNLNVYTPSMKGAIGNVIYDDSPGDLNVIDSEIHTNWGSTAPSDEGINAGLRVDLFDMVPYKATISSNSVSDSFHRLKVETSGARSKIGAGYAVIDTTRKKILKVTATANYCPDLGVSNLCMIGTYTTASGENPDFTASIFTTLAAPVLVGITGTTSVNITSWSASAPKSNVSLYTFHFTGKSPRAGAYEILRGFTSTATTPGLNGYVAQVAGVSGNSFTASIYNYTGAAVSDVSETTATATSFYPNRIPNDQTAVTSVMLKTPPSGKINTTQPLVFADFSDHASIEQAIPLTVSPPVDGVVVITIPLRFPHTGAVLLAQGGLAGYGLADTTFDSDQNIVWPIIGSRGTNQVEFMFNQGSLYRIYGNRSDNYAVFPRAMVISPLNPATGLDDGNGFYSEPMPDFTAGDSIEEPLSPYASFVYDHLNVATYNPYVGYGGLDYTIPGWNGITVNNPSSAFFTQTYGQQPSPGFPGLASEGGNPNLSAPLGWYIKGFFSNTIYQSHPPEESMMWVGCPDRTSTISSYYVWENTPNNYGDGLKYYEPSGCGNVASTYPRWLQYTGLGFYSSAFTVETRGNYSFGNPNRQTAGISQPSAGVVSVDTTTAGNGLGAIKTAQLVPSGSAPAMAAGPAAGTSSSCTSITGKNMAGTISCTTGTSTTTGTLASITFSSPLTTAPYGCTLMPRNAAAAATSTSVYTTSPSRAAWTIGMAIAPAASTTYQWSYICE